MTFDWADFLAPLDPWVLVMCVVLGSTVGFLLHISGHLPLRGHSYFMVAAGAIFFIPLALLRGLQGSPVWERFLATFILWILFVLGADIGTRLRRRL